MSSIQQVIFGLGCCLFGGFFSRFALQTWRRGRESSSWLKVPGRIDGLAAAQADEADGRWSIHRAR
jgi:hypothetical protein